MIGIFAFFIPAFTLSLGLSVFHVFSRKKAWLFSKLFLFIFLGLLFVLPVSGAQRIFLVFSFIINTLGLAIFILLFSRTAEKKLSDESAKVREIESVFQKKEELRNQRKSELEKLSKEIQRSLSLYGAVRGLGEALSWDELVPHIDFAIQHCLGVTDYQLYLTEESADDASASEKKVIFQKKISRGGRIAEPPITSLAQATPLGQSAVPNLHQRHNEIYLEVPIAQNSKTIGLLWARISQGQVKNQKDEILRASVELSDELGMGLQKALLFSSLEKLSRLDGLTGVCRRHIFDERLNEEIRRANHFSTVFSILLADLDHFKQINDTYGHQAGDEILRRLGEILKESIYETDFVARYGGEEFVIIFPQADPQGVKRKAELLRERIAQENFMVGWERLGMTVSIGIAHYPQDGVDSSTLVNYADQCLYAAKRTGRNKVIDSADRNIL